MYLNYASLERDRYGNPETPDLILQTMSEETIGVIPGAYNLKINVKFAEPSEIEFDVSSVVDGETNWIYDRLAGYKLIYTRRYGIYVTMEISSETDGVSTIKHVKGYSLEYFLSGKKFFLEEGTYKFYNPLNKKDSDTVIGRILEIAPDWRIGEIDPNVQKKYRTFDEYDDYLLNFMYSSAAEKYRCVFVFDPYARTISVYDADREIPTIPIYLDSDNLITKLEQEELAKELVTAIRPHGADNLDIREVNPTGDDWIYNLSWFIGNGDIPETLAERWNGWQDAIAQKQREYNCLTALRASAIATLLSEQANLANLQMKLDTDLLKRDVVLQKQALSADDEKVQTELSGVNSDITADRSYISDCENRILTIKNASGIGLDTGNENYARSYSGKIDAIVNELKFQNYFTDSERFIFSRYITEQDITEETFVASSLETVSPEVVSNVSNQIVQISELDADILDLTSEYHKTMYAIRSGGFRMGTVACDIARGTLEVNTDNSFVMSFYAGRTTIGEESYGCGTLVLSGRLNAGTFAVTPGEALQFTAPEASLYFTVGVSDYQKYSVQMELYDYAEKLLRDLATPAYEFSVDSGNFIFAKEFEPFQERLELGKGIHLNLGGGEVIQPYIIEFALDFENREKLSLVFSNRFKRHDNVNTLKDMLDNAKNTSRSFDAAKHMNNMVVRQANAVAEFMESALIDARNQVISAANQSVIIDGGGIHVYQLNVDGDNAPAVNRKCEIRITNGMIAMSNDYWETAKLAIGNFETESGGYFGVNAEVIAGRLIVGQELVIQPEDGSFTIDENGITIDSMKLTILHNNQPERTLSDIISNTLDKALTSDSVLSAKKLEGIIDASQAQMQAGGGNVLFDRDGIWLLDGTSKAGSTKAVWMNSAGIRFGSGQKTEDPGKDWSDWSTAISADGIMAEALYGKTIEGLTINGGALNIGPNNNHGWNFMVDTNGNLTANSGTFGGTVRGATFQDKNGNSMTKTVDGVDKFDAKYLNLRGLNVNNKFIVAEDGTVTINGGNISFSGGSDPNTGGSTGSGDGAAAAIANGTYSGGTFIDGRKIFSPEIYTNELNIIPKTTSGVYQETTDAKPGKFNLYGYYDGLEYNMFTIEYYGGSEPWVNLKSIADAQCQMLMDIKFRKNAQFDGEADFSNATVRGLNLTFS